MSSSVRPRVSTPKIPSQTAMILDLGHCTDLGYISLTQKMARTRVPAISKCPQRRERYLLEEPEFELPEFELLLSVSSPNVTLKVFVSPLRLTSTDTESPTL